MLNPNELWYWRTRLPSGKYTPVFRAATRDDAVAYCEHVGWTNLDDLEGFSPDLSVWHGVPRAAYGLEVSDG